MLILYLFKKLRSIISFTLIFGLAGQSVAQSFDTTAYLIKVEFSEELDPFFKNDPHWRGADGASSIDLGNGKILWLFSDSFVGSDTIKTRKKARIIRNSIAIQEGYDPHMSSIKFYYGHSGKKPRPFFYKSGKSWFWTGHGIMIKDRLILFLLDEHPDKNGLGFAAKGWYAVIVQNPLEEPYRWKMHYVKGGETYGTIAGSAAILKEGEYLYAFGSVEPATHEVYLLRWKQEDAYRGKLAKPEWWTGEKWALRTNEHSTARSLFSAQTEYSVHYDSTLQKYLQIQSYGFGEAEIGLRISDRLEGPWTTLYTFCKPDYRGIQKPLMYSAKAHPELHADGIYITYNLNSFDFSELIENQSIYFPKFIRVNFSKK